MEKPDEILDALSPADAQSIPADQQAFLLEYVNSHCYDSALCLNAVADALSTSIYAVSRTFKEITGVGFKEYVTAKRLEQACRLLTGSDETISEIAVLSGFENATYFTTVFKHEYGMPPTKYRAITQKKPTS